MAILPFATAAWPFASAVAETAAVESALPLSADEEKLVAGFLKKETTAEHIELEKAIRPELLGGLVIKYGDRIFDGSLKTRLGQLKKVFK